MAKQKGESNQGLVVALVFFILATIALGVTTYLGYSTQQDDLQKRHDQFKTEAANRKAEADWYRFQALTYRGMLGEAKDHDQLDLLRRSYVSGAGELGKGTLGRGVADLDEATAVISKLENPKGDRKFVYNDTTKQYGNNFAELIKQKTREIKDVVDRNTELTTEKDNLLTTVKQKDDQLDKQKKDFDAALAKLGMDNKMNTEKRDTAREELIAEVDRLTKANAALLTAAADKEKKLTTDLKRALDTLNDQKRMLLDANDQLLALKSRGSETAPRALRTDWKIATIQGNLPYINLGSADNVKAQLTFNIHGVGPDGQPLPKPKGSLEVVNVIGPHLSQARITSVADANRDPVLVGDVLNNSTWNPYQKRHVAIAGYIDLYGDKRENLAELRRTLERQNVIVDAYLDLKDFSMQGAMTLQTDYLILGVGPEQLPFSVVERDGFGKKLSKGIEDAQAEAKKYGIPTIGLYKYLESIGYKMPRPLGN